MDLPNPAPDSSRIRRPRLRLSVRALMLLVLICGAGMGWFAWKTRRVNAQRMSVTAIRQWNGVAAYDYQWSDGREIPFARPTGPAWLRRRLGDQFFHEVAF